MWSWAFRFQLPIYLCGKLYGFTGELLGVVWHTVGKPVGSEKQMQAESPLLRPLLFGRPWTSVCEQQQRRSHGVASLITEAQCVFLL